MTTERRYSARHPFVRPVQIRYGKRRFLGAQASNLSLRGMYLTVCNLTLPHGTPVGLELTCMGREWSIEAVVIHRDHAGVGLMFRQPQPALYQGLLRGFIPTQYPQGDRANRPPATVHRPLLARR